MADPQTVIEGTLKYRDNKKWKPRWCVIRKLSPVADCLHLQLYRDSKDRCKNGPTKASLSLEGFLGMETGFTLDKESNTMALICSEVVVVLAFDSRELLIQWQVKVRANLLEEHQFLVQIAHVPVRSKLASGPARLHLLDYMFCLTAGVPPKLLGIWPLKELRRFGVVDGKFCFEGGSRCGKGEGLHVLLTNQAKDLVQAFDMASRGRLPGRRKMSVRKNTGGGESNPKCRPQGCCNTDGTEKIVVNCSTESSTKPLLSSGSDGGSDGGCGMKIEKGGEESHIRPCHMHYRWPSCIVPCGVTANRDAVAEDGQHKSLNRTTPGAPGPMFWAVGHCQGCGLHYTRRSSDKEKAQTPAENRFTDDPSGFTPHWTMDLNIVSPSKDGTHPVSGRPGQRNRTKAPHDRSSLCSQSSQSSGTSTSSNGSSSSCGSEYSVPKNCMEAFYDRPKNIHHLHHNPPYNRLNLTEDGSAKSEAPTPTGLRCNLGPIHEATGLPSCTCWNRKPDHHQESMFPAGELVCTCWKQKQRHSTDVDMPSFSSSGSSNASPSTSPKKQLPFIGVPILLPCTCGKISNNPTLNYDVPKACIPVKDFKDRTLGPENLGRNITESAHDTQETKIINKVDNSENLEFNGNKTNNINQAKIIDTTAKTPTFPQQLCSCQRLVFCPSNLLPSWYRMQTQASQEPKHPVKTSSEYATVTRKPACGCNVALENENQKRMDEQQNLNLQSKQKPMMYPLPLNCPGSKMAFSFPMNTWKKDNANHIYVNLKYLQETAAAAAMNQGAPPKLIPYYANLYFLQTLSFYENAGLLAVRPTNLVPHPEADASTKVSDHSRVDDTKRGSTGKKKMEPPSASGVYEMMSFNTSDDSSGENYMMMQPGVLTDGEQPVAEKTIRIPAPTPHSSSTIAADEASGPWESSGFEADSLPLRPFMPVLLPFHDHTGEHSHDTSKLEEESMKGVTAANLQNICKKCPDDDNRSSRSNSLGDLKMNVFRRGRSSSTESRQTSADKTREDCSGANVCCSPKSTPIRKHPILTKLTFRSKEKSFSTDEITPPSTAPSSPDSMFIENIHKYPFHRSADCLQLNEEYRLSEEDLSQDPEVLMSQSMDKCRSNLSIKRSSSVPCKGNPQHHHPPNSSESASATCAPPHGQAAVFSHFIAYHGSLPRRCSGNTASRHSLVDKKVATSSNQDQACDQKQNSDSSNMIFISECKQCHQLVTSPEGLLVLDAKSMTSSSSSDMSDYMESLSLCSRSSSGSSGVGGGCGEYIRTEELSGSQAKVSASCTSALRPRSGKEYHSFDRVVFQDNCPYIPVADCSHLTLPCLKPFVEDLGESSDNGEHPTGENISFKPNSSNKTNSPSPGYVSSSPGNPDFISPEKSMQHFVFPKESAGTKDLNYLEVVSVSESEPPSPLVKSGTVQYAVIDLVATAAARKLSTERAAQLRESSTKTQPSSTSAMEADK